MNITEQNLDLLLSHIPEHHQAAYRTAMTSNSARQVRCLSKSCNGDVIATIDDQGIVHETDGRLFASKMRVDGVYGFQCSCGNDSREAPQERERLGMANPTPEILAAVMRDVNLNPSVYPIIEGRQTIDDFSIEDI